MNSRAIVALCWRGSTDPASAPFHRVILPVLTSAQRGGNQQDMIAQLSDQDKAIFLGMFIAVVAPTWLAWWNARLAKRQVTRNGGGSLKDVVERLDAKVDRVEATLELHTVEISTIKARQRTVLTNTSKDEWRADDEAQANDGD